LAAAAASSRDAESSRIAIVHSSGRVWQAGAASRALRSSGGAAPRSPQPLHLARLPSSAPGACPSGEFASTVITFSSTGMSVHASLVEIRAGAGAPGGSV